MYDWRGQFIEQDDPDPGSGRLRDEHGHYLPQTPAGIRVFRYGEEDPTSEYYACPVYDLVPLRQPIPEGWQWDQEYYACKRCGIILADHTREA